MLSFIVCSLSYENKNFFSSALNIKVYYNIKSMLIQTTPVPKFHQILTFAGSVHIPS